MIGRRSWLVFLQLHQMEARFLRDVFIPPLFGQLSRPGQPNLGLV
jgi:hypothetical protein